MEDDLNSQYDVIVLGTGLPECILAAAAARIGKTVLHLDKNEYYGGDWASFNFDGIKKWIASKIDNGETLNTNVYDDNFSTHLKEGESVHKLHWTNSIENAKEYCFMKTKSDVEPEQSEAELPLEDNASLKINDGGSGDCPGNLKHDEVTADDSVNNEESEVTSVPNETSSQDKTETEKITNNSCGKQWSYEEFELQWRKFNLDLAPKLLFAKGSLVDLLISSNIARYAEFKSVSRILTFLNEKLEQVPCCRSDVFSTREVTIVEKRMLMKFLNFCSDFNKNPDEYEGFQDKTFHEFLKTRKMTPNVIHYIIHAIAMVNENTPTVDGLKATQRFLKSLGHYGNTPFLWTLYGSGELPQCFCRLCAVFGGVYCLKRAAEALILNTEKKCVGIITQNKRIDCNCLVSDASYLCKLDSSLDQKLSYKRTSHAMLITDQSLLKSEKEQLTFLRLPPMGETHTSVTVLELGPASMACPNDLYVVHMFCEREEDAESDLLTAIEILFDKYDQDEGKNNLEKPKVLWSLYYTSRYITTNIAERNIVDNVFITSGPNSDVDMDLPVTEAKEIFALMFPQEEFLPRAPDPDEIIIDEPDPETPKVESVSPTDSNSSIDTPKANCDRDAENKDMDTDISKELSDVSINTPNE